MALFANFDRNPADVPFPISVTSFRVAGDKVAVGQMALFCKFLT
jgi:hypothetical protein